MTRITLCITFFLLIGINVFAQEAEPKVKFCVEIPVSMSVIPAAMQTISAGGIKVRVPKLNNYRNPLYGINMGVSYPLCAKVRAAVVVGINGSFYQNHLYYPNEYLSILTIPVLARVLYEHKIRNRLFSVSDVSAGYNFYHNVSGNTKLGFDFEEKGGTKANISSGIGYRFGERMVALQVGFDVTVYNNSARLNKISNSPSTDFVNYKSLYQTLLVKLGIAF